MYYKKRIGLLKDYTIVKIRMWTEKDEPEQEIYFFYSFWYTIKNSRRNAWAYKKDFLGFFESKSEARRAKRRLKKLN